ncbi:hypothetical protein ACJMK2_009355 [Sinanodonta woodiana]|uniref:Uncharacterized protein n=1 Tax=Sinanodonta woodiana TaxID=1069815 RepID=A0ABD3VEX9_SINWO
MAGALYVSTQIITSLTVTTVNIDAANNEYTYTKSSDQVLLTEANKSCALGHVLYASHSLASIIIGNQMLLSEPGVLLLSGAITKDDISTGKRNDNKLGLACSL